ncbi:MAG: dihydrofolate reductase family protein [Thermomicrobiales bacterium]
MAKVLLGMTMSLDGFINDQDGSVARLYPDLAALRETEELQRQIAATGAVVMGRRAYNMADGDLTDYEFQTPIFVVTHQAPAYAPKGQNDRLRVHFVTDGLASAIAQARETAGEREVTVIGGANTAQQCLNAGLVDELQVEIRPVFLGVGTRFFEGVAANIELEPIVVTQTPLTTNLRFRVVK